MKKINHKKNNPTVNKNTEGINNNSKSEEKNKRLVLIFTLVIVCVVVALSAVIISVYLTPNFSYKEMSIALPRSFHSTSYDGFDAVYEKDNAAVFVKENTYKKLGIPNDYSIDTYGKELVASKSGSQIMSALTKANGLTYFEYSATGRTDKKDYTYVVFIFKQEEAFWVIQFSCGKADYPKMKEDFFKWAKTIKFE